MILICILLIGVQKIDELLGILFLNNCPKQHLFHMMLICILQVQPIQMGENCMKTEGLACLNKVLICSPCKKSTSLLFKFKPGKYATDENIYGSGLGQT